MLINFIFILFNWVSFVVGYKLLLMINETRKENYFCCISIKTKSYWDLIRNVRTNVMEDVHKFKFKEKAEWIFDISVGGIIFFLRVVLTYS